MHGGFGPCHQFGRRWPIARTRILPPALDPDHAAIYARIVSRRDGFSEATSNQHPEAAVRISSRKLAVPLLLALSGCHLLDQTDFQPRPTPRVVAPVPNPESRTALLTIDFARPDTDYRSAVATTIRMVEARRPGVLYDVVGVVQDIAGAQDARTRAAEVMTAIESGGVNPARVQLGITLDPNQRIPQVRVYLR